MGWGSAIFVGLVTGAIAAIVAYFVADRAADWLNISNVDLQGAAFVMLMSLLAFVLGIAIGIFVCRYLGQSGLLRGLGLSLAIAVGAIGAAGAIAWLAGTVGGDRAPEIDGRPLALEVELRLTPDFVPDNALPGGLQFLLSTRDAGSLRVDLDIAAKRQEGGRWIYPGKVDLFTTRSDTYFYASGWSYQQVFIYANFQPPFDPANPAWSDWLTAAANPAAARESGPDGLAVRYRVVWGAPAAP